jgi:uncharacterized protein (DUF697 family)
VTETAAGTTTAGATATHSTSEATRSLAIVKHYTILCAEAMWIPFWWASSPSITALQLKMLEEVSQVYGVEIAPDRTKALVASLGGGGLSLIISQHPLSLALKAWVLAIPVIGIPLRLGTGPAIMAGYTWLLGQAFITHYESGGTYLDFRMRQVGSQLREAVGMPRPA